MKTNLTVNSIALRNLKARTKQYIIMITGIILAMVFSSGSVLFLSCIDSSNKEIKNLELGKQDYIICNASEKEINNLISSGTASEAAKFSTLGYAYSSEDKQENGVSVSSLDKKARDTYYLSFKEGKYPENPGEIAIEESALTMLNIKAGVGDNIELNLMVQNGKDYLSAPVKKTYKLAGIVKDKRINLFSQFDYDASLNVIKNIPGAYVSSKETSEPGGKARTDWLVFKADDDAFLALYNSLQSGSSDGGINSAASIFDTSSSGLSSYSSVNSSYLGIILAVIFYIASAFAVINSFASNLNERKKQIGMLKTVGATKKQIINIYGREAVIIALITLPVSLLISFFGLKIMSVFIDEIFIFKPKAWVILLSALVSLASVIAAAVIPLIKASRISPVQAIKNNDYSYKQQKRKIKSQKKFNTSKLIAKRSLTFNRSKRAVVSIFLIVIIIGGGFGFGTIKDIINDSYEDPYDYRLTNYPDKDTGSPYNYSQKAGYDNEDKEEILSNPNIESVYAGRAATALINKENFTDYDKIICYGDNYYAFDSKYSDEEFGNYDNFLSQLTPENLDEYLLNNYNSKYTLFREKFNIQNELLPVSLGGADPEAIEILKPFVSDGKINIDKILSGEEIILVAPKNADYDITYMNSGKYYLTGINVSGEDQSNVRTLKSASLPYKAGDVLKLSIATTADTYDENSSTDLPDDLKKIDVSVKIGAVINDIDYNWETFATPGEGHRFRIITSNTFFDKVCPNIKYSVLNINAKGHIDYDKNESITALLTNINNKNLGGDIFSKFAFESNQKNEIKEITILGLVIIILFILVCTSIINNSLTAQIRGEKRQIGTLRAVGASLREIMYSYIRQLLNVLLTGIVSGYALYFIAYGAMALSQKIKYGTDSEMVSVSVIPSLVACGIIFIICSFNLWLKIRKEMKNSIIDNIREL